MLDRAERAEHLAPHMTSSFLNLFRTRSFIQYFRTAAICVSTICTLFLAILLVTTTVFSLNFVGRRLCVVCVYSVQCISC